MNWMEGEIKNLIFVWMTAVLCLWYCHAIVAKLLIKPGIPRLLFLLPVISLFFILPLNLTTIHLAGLSSFFLTWLCNFKLLLFSFGRGPLSSTADAPQLMIPLSRFIPIACLPIQNHTQNGTKSPLNYASKLLLLAFLIKMYDYHQLIHHNLRLLLYCFHIYFSLEILLAFFATFARSIFALHLAPQFDEPYLATSLQDFWGKRWNLMVSTILHPTVYLPVRSLSSRFISSKWAPLPAVLASFLVSGIMHELIFYYIGRLTTTWEVTCFFLVNGLCLGVEIGLKRAVGGRFRLPVAVSRPLTLGFVLVTAFWLFFPPFMRFKPDVKGCAEAVAFIEFVKHGRLVNPANVSCPLLL